jgi:ABC-type dipeptide/oligopeptide/nickel transport system ATPase component
MLEVSDLSVEITRRDRGGSVRVVDGVGFSLEKGEVLGLVGESGSGKTVTARSLMRLLPSQVARIVRGRIALEGEDVLAASEERMQAIRGRRMAMVFQEPMTALNPVLTVGRQLLEVVGREGGLPRLERRSRAIALLERVRIADPRTRFDQYPHQLSGGMRQRVMIAMALALDPIVLIADEPTTALDVTVQAQIISLIDELRREKGTTVLWITHDLGVVAQICDRVAVMKAGAIVESGATDRVLLQPEHAYTRALLAALELPRRRA